MNPDKQYLNTKIYNIIRQFEPEKFNNFIPKEKYALISELITVVSNSFTTTIDPNKILFVNENKFDGQSVLFNSYDNTIIFNEKLLTKKLDDCSIINFLDNIISETIRYCQKQNKLYKDDFNSPVGYPYNIYQIQNIETINLTSDILTDCKKYLSKNLKENIESLVDIKKELKNISIQEITKLGYESSIKDVKAQINGIKPFYARLNEINQFRKDEDLEIIEYKNIKIEAARISKKMYGILSIDDKYETAFLYFSVLNNTCYINELYSIDCKEVIGPVLKKNKLKLVDVLLTIIGLGNKTEKINCTQIKIVPISAVDGKDEYKHFITNIENKKFKTPIMMNSLYRQIKNHLFAD